MTSKTVCSKHEHAHDVGTCCPWCEPPEPVVARQVVDVELRDGRMLVKRVYPPNDPPGPMRVWTYSCRCASCVAGETGMIKTVPLRFGFTL